MRRKNPEERAKEVVACINRVKETLSNFTKKDLGTLLRELKCPYHSSVYSILRQKNLITQSTKGVWNFSISEPVHFKVIQSELDKLAIANAASNLRWLDKKKDVISIPKSISFEDALLVIKQHGGKVLMPVTDWKEV